MCLQEKIESLSASVNSALLERNALQREFDKLSGNYSTLQAALKAQTERYSHAVAECQALQQLQGGAEAAHEADPGSAAADTRTSCRAVVTDGTARHVVGAGMTSGCATAFAFVVHSLWRKLAMVHHHASTS